MECQPIKGESLRQQQILYHICTRDVKSLCYVCRLVKFGLVKSALRKQTDEIGKVVDVTKGTQIRQQEVGKHKTTLGENCRGLWVICLSTSRTWCHCVFQISFCLFVKIGSTFAGRTCYWHCSPYDCIGLHQLISERTFNFRLRAESNANWLINFWLSIKHFCRVNICEYD